MTRRAASQPRALDVDDALNAAISRLVTPHDILSSERRALPDTPRGRLFALLREIEETVMPRQIALSRDGDALANLIVANRRLFRITDAGVSTESLNAQNLEQFTSNLLELSKTVTSITTQPNRDDASNSGGTAGASAAKLRAALGLDIEENDIAHLTGLLAPTALAQMSWGDGSGAHDFSGADSWRALLETHAKRITDHITADDAKKLSASPATKGMALPLSRDTLLVVACKDQAGVASITPRAEGLKAISTWQVTGK